MAQFVSSPHHQRDSKRTSIEESLQAQFLKGHLTVEEFEPLTALLVDGSHQPLGSALGQPDLFEVFFGPVRKVGAGDLGSARQTSSHFLEIGPLTRFLEWSS
jgi:hypothetical protein